MEGIAVRVVLTGSVGHVIGQGFLTNRVHLSQCLSKERAIQQRLADCPPPAMEEAEKRAIGDTLAALAVLKTSTDGKATATTFTYDSKLYTGNRTSVN